MRCDYDHGHLLRDEGDRSVFHFGGRITLGMDIRDLFEFEGAFHGYREIIAATEIDEVLGIGKSLGKVRYALVLPEYAFNLIGYLT